MKKSIRLPFPLPVALITVAIFVLPTPAYSASLKWIGLVNVDPSNYNCKDLQNSTLESWQYKFCVEKSVYMPYIFSAASAFARECETTFSKYKWNCTTVRMYPTEDLETTTREQAVVAAFAAGIMIEQLVNGIRGSDMNDSCLMLQKLAPPRKFKTRQKHICDVDYRKAEELTLLFLGVTPATPRLHKHFGIISVPTVYLKGPRKGKASEKNVQYVLAHNYMIGIKVVHEVKYEKCPPFGAAYCYYHLPDDRLREYYRERYTRAMRVAMGKSLGKHLVAKSHRFSSSQASGNSADSLIFVTASHDYCDYMVDLHGKVQSLGTYDRECDPERDVPNKCETFCCNRGHYSTTTTMCNGLSCPVPLRYERCTCANTTTVQRWFCNGPLVNTSSTIRPRNRS